MESKQHLVSRKEVAERLGVGMTTVDLWAKQGRFPYYKLGKSVRFEMKDIDRYVEASFQLRK